MGLDQAIRKLSPELAEKLIARSAMLQQDEYDEEAELTHEEYNTMVEVWTGRKENHIQRAVEEITGQEVRNCDYLFLTRDNVDQLLEKLVAVSMDHSQADAVLPTQEGFFYGTTEYGEWYFRNIADELEAFKEILNEWDEDSRYAYWAWW